MRLTGGERKEKLTFSFGKKAAADIESQTAAEVTLSTLASVMAMPWLLWLQTELLKALTASVCVCVCS